MKCAKKKEEARPLKVVEVAHEDRVLVPMSFMPESRPVSPTSLVIDNEHVRMPISSGHFTSLTTHHETLGRVITEVEHSCGGTLIIERRGSKVVIVKDGCRYEVECSQFPDVDGVFHYFDFTGVLRDNVIVWNDGSKWTIPPGSCPSCLCTLVWTEHVVDQGASDGSWHCNNMSTCGSTSASMGPWRWYCQICCKDYCDVCMPRSSTPPLTPAKPQLVQVTCNQLKVAWRFTSATPPVTHTALKMREGGTDDWLFLDTTNGMSKLVRDGGLAVRSPTDTIVVSGLRPNVVYEVVVMMRNAAGWSPESPLSQIELQQTRSGAVDAIDLEDIIIPTMNVETTQPGPGFLDIGQH